FPDREGAAPRQALELADGGVVDVDGLGEVADEGPEELLAGAAGGPLDHCPEGVQVVGHHGGGRPLPCARRRPPPPLTQRRGRVRIMAHEAPPGPRRWRKAARLLKGRGPGPAPGTQCELGVAVTFYPFRGAGTAAGEGVGQCPPGAGSRKPTQGP